MNRAQLAHILRAAARITEDGDILVLGSQSILGTADDRDLPPEATMSVEADIAFFSDLDDAKSDLVDATVGEASQFHQTFGYYAQGVSITTAHLPAGWRDRLVPFDQPAAEPSQAVCLDPHDLVVAKLYANRDKDREFTTALLVAELVDPTIVLERIDRLDTPEAVKTRIRATLRACAARRPPTGRDLT